MESSPKLGSFNYRYGAYAAGIGIVFSLMLHVMDMTYERSTMIQAVQFLIPTAIAILAITTFKKDNAGLISLGQSIKIGVGVFLVAAIITLIYFTIFINVVEPDFISNTAQLQADALRESKPDLDESIIAMQQENTQKYFYISYPFILIMNIIFGLIIGLITGLFVKKS